MGVERQCINPGLRGKTLRINADYSTLEVGDWFIVRTNMYRRAVLRSLETNPMVMMWRFKWEEIEFHTYRVERIA